MFENARGRALVGLLLLSVTVALSSAAARANARPLRVAAPSAKSSRVVPATPLTFGDAAAIRAWVHKQRHLGRPVPGAKPVWVRPIPTSKAAGSTGGLRSRLSFFRSLSCSFSTDCWGPVWDGDGNKILGTYNGGCDDSSGVQLWVWSNADATCQTWIFVGLSDGYVGIVLDNTNLVMNVRGNSYRAGTQIIAYSIGSSYASNEQFTVASNPGVANTYYIEPGADQSYGLSVGSFGNGGGVTLQLRNGSESEAWGLGSLVVY